MKTARRETPARKLKHRGDELFAHGDRKGATAAYVDSLMRTPESKPCPRCRIRFAVDGCPCLVCGEDLCEEDWDGPSWCGTAEEREALVAAGCTFNENDNPQSMEAVHVAWESLNGRQY